MHRAAIKWFLNVLTAHSSVFIQFMCGGTNCNGMSISLQYCYRSSDSSFFMMCIFGVNPHFPYFSFVFLSYSVFRYQF